MTCREVLEQYLKENAGKWIKKVELYVVAEDWSPESVGRRLRELQDDGIVSVDYYDGKYSKNLAKYTYGKEVKKIPSYEIVEMNGRRVAVLIEK